MGTGILAANRFLSQPVRKAAGKRVKFMGAIEDAAIKVLEILALPFLTFVLGRGAAKKKQELDVATLDSQNSKMLWERVGKLEDRVQANMDKIEEVRNEKIKLSTEIVGLKQQIATLEIVKLQFEQERSQHEKDRVIYIAQLSEMEQRLAAKGEELRHAQERLHELERNGEYPL